METNGDTLLESASEKFPPARQLDPRRLDLLAELDEFTRSLHRAGEALRLRRQREAR